MEISLKPKEKKVLGAFIKKLKVPKRKTKHPSVIASLGLVGAGKEEVAQVFAREIGAVCVSADELRVALRKQKMGYEHVREIALEIGKEVAKRDGNVVLSSDYSHPEKRNILKRMAKEKNMYTYFVRVVADPDVMMGRIISATYGKNNLFYGARTPWKGAHKPSVVKLREMWRRTPQHYSWMNEDGGKWVQKSMEYIFGEIDTTDPKKWKSKVKQIAMQIAARS